VDNLSVSARGERGRSKQLLEGVSFDVSQGQFIAVIGASGCGKSTLVKTLAGLILPTSGRVLFAGHPVSDCDWGQLSILNA
jgi:ABC-type bacteriocin/lantibiotic exporter with double-glycine peptidase domain